MSELKGLEDLLARIQNLQKLRHTQGGLLAGAAHIKTRVAQYPAQKSLSRQSVYGKPFASDKQRRFFFAALRKGQIHVPYRRTMALFHRWTVRTYNNGLTAEIGNITPYGPGMQGAGTQWRMAKAIGWQTDEAVLEREGPAVVEFVRAGVEKDLGT